MSNETPTGPAGTPEGRGHSGSGDEFSSPLQARAQFLKNWGWQSVISINRGACQRGRAQHGFNSETSEACAEDWQTLQSETLTLGQALDHLRSYHRRAPFLFFNGNTFASIGRELAFVLFSDLPPVRNREVASAIAHYIAGVLDRDAMVEIVESLSQTADWKTGDRVQTLRGSLRGVIVRILADGRLLWRPDQRKTELIALPESMIREKMKR